MPLINLSLLDTFIRMLNSISKGGAFQWKNGYVDTEGCYCTTYFRAANGAYIKVLHMKPF